MFTNKTFNNQNGITADNITTNTILSSAGATILSTTAADSSINLKITTNAVTSNAVYYDVANDKLSYGAVSSGGGSILATANTFTNTNTFNAAVNLNGIPSATKTSVLYYDTTSKAISYGAAPSGGNILTTANTFTNLNTFSNSVTFQSAVNFSLRLTFPFWSVATGGNIPSDYSGGFTVITMGTGTNVTLFNPNITSGFVMTIQNIIAGQTITITTGGGGFYGAGLTNGSSTLSLYYLQAVRLNCNGSSWFVVSLTHNMTLYPTLASANTFAGLNTFSGGVSIGGSVSLTGITSATKTNVLYYDDVTKAISFGAGGGGSGDNTFSGTNNFTGAFSLSSNPFRYIPWRTCGYTFTAGTSFGSAITATTAPTPATGSTTKYIYSVVGNTMYLQFSYSNPTANTGGSGTGVYLYNLPSGYTIDTSLIQTVTPGVAATTNQNAYGTSLGNASFEIFSPYSQPATCLGVSVYATSTATIAIFIPSYYQGSISSLYIWHGSTYFGYNPATYHRYTFNCSFPIV
jgi:hypothetical protein